MNPNFIISVALLSPTLYLIVSILSRLHNGLRPQLIKSTGMFAATFNTLSAIISIYYVYNHGLIESELIGYDSIGFSIRLDALSILMFNMIAIIGFVVMKFTMNYLDGDQAQGKFIGRLANTIAAVQLLVLSGNLGILLISWILTSIALHKLLTFYSDRPIAFIAARKKFIMARLGDFCLLVAASFLYMEFQTGNLEVIFSELKTMIAEGTSSYAVEAASVGLALAAIFKSAQFPTHGWLIEVMETPTPVSALLHAGLLNAGPFLLIRMAFVMEVSTAAPIMIIIVGGLTALFASLSFLTQTSVKTALGYSSVAHMGFSLLVCGLGVYPAAMLHLVAHSFYKAHSFLSSGSVIEQIRAAKVKKGIRLANPLRIGLGILLALGLYFGFALLWGVDPYEELPLMVIGTVIIMGLATIFSNSLDSNGGFRLLLQALLLSLLVTVAFFSLESASHHILLSQIPEAGLLSTVEIILVGSLLLFFSAATMIQIASPLIQNRPLFRAMAIHLRNGLYANALFDRLVGAMHIHSTTPLPEDEYEVEPARPMSRDSFMLKSYEEQTA